MANKNLTIHFENTSAMCIYEWEMSGQISDGKYENSRPYDHWKWLWDINEMVVDGTKGIEGYSCYRRVNWDGTFTKKYNLNDWFTKYINPWRKNGKNDHIWATRIIGYGKFGRIYPNLTYEEMRKLGEVRIFLESLQMNIECGEKDAEKLFNNITNFSTCEWRQKYYEDCKDYFTLEFVKKFIEIDYDLNECKADVKSMQDSINNNYTKRIFA